MCIFNAISFSLSFEKQTSTCILRMHPFQNDRSANVALMSHVFFAKYFWIGQESVS
eukprot:m.93329 g.93329  ORF g.93329 m.93329 type:complete len:56 (+) comp16532_c0_seq2:1719-1886(+)